jgi:hypothetical protein
LLNLKQYWPFFMKINSLIAIFFKLLVGFKWCLYTTPWKSNNRYCLARLLYAYVFIPLKNNSTKFDINIYYHHTFEDIA